MEDRVVPRSSKRITQKYKPLSHKGVDIGWSSVEENNKVHANCRGIVREVVDGKTNNTKSAGAASWGNYVLVQHPNGYYTRYAHLKKCAMVKVGQNVDESTVVGIMGDSGKAYGKHLHFEVATGYSSKTRINPTPYLTEPVYDEAPTPAPTPTPEPTPTPTPTPAPTTTYAQVTSRVGVWARHGIGFTYPKVIAVPWGHRVEVLERNAGKSNGYYWDKVIYRNDTLYMPNKWFKYIDK